MTVLMRGCPLCGKDKPDAEFRMYSRGQRINCETCDAKRYPNIDVHKDECIDSTDPRHKMWCRAKAGAKDKGMEFSITSKDIPTPTHCRYMGIELDYSPSKGVDGKLRQNAASLDRIDNNKGYIPGNIQVISALANRMKQDATIEQLVAFAEGVLRVHKP